jgi:hypothetical protein
MDWRSLLLSVLSLGDVYVIAQPLLGSVVDSEGSLPIWRNFLQPGEAKNFTIFQSAFRAQMELDKMRDMDPAFEEFKVMPIVEFSNEARLLIDGLQ